MPTAWGFCDPCQRWFYPENPSDVTTAPSCPVCATPATVVRDRPEEAAAS